MIQRFRRYIEKKKLELNTEKSKVLVFEKGRRRKDQRRWNWGNEIIEEVKEMRYLGYILQKNGGTEKHLLERLRRATIIMKHT